MDVADFTGGGAPLLGEPPPIELANTAHAVRGRRRDGLLTTEHLAAWLRDMRPRLAVPLTDADLRGVTDDDLARARELRDAVRSLAAATATLCAAHDGDREAGGAGEDGVAATRTTGADLAEPRPGSRATPPTPGHPVLDPRAAETLNRHARRSPRWRELLLDPEPHAVVRSADRPVAAALAALAEEAIDLFAGPVRHKLRACQGPGCILHFVRESPRREWCSPGCGNRARAARHYAKVRRP
ncbi:CGNR zinc finger domain-containing protein [Nonomuraea indica]|uniref:CGNR zinc finger domain-containing protein n=1 Tax=Nonomuraea indica TaxID=1581193 RepID=UPI001FE59C8D|nr:CGNR zinc finger domain-containing protein [Nonomuraea indica]